jgi:hypothetical protein
MTDDRRRWASALMSSAFWTVALLAGLLWPSRLIGPLDGAPLDGHLEAIAIGLLLPSLWFLRPEFLRGRLARITVASLLFCKIASSLLVTQTGWCGLLTTPYDAQVQGSRLEQSWDARTFWTGTPPSCSAIVARSYELTRDFPAWAVNVPFGADYDFTSQMPSLPIEHPRPPNGAFTLYLSGFMYPGAPGLFRVDVGPDMRLTGRVDGVGIESQPGQSVQLPIGAGQHAVDLRLDLRGPGWRFKPSFDGRDLFDAVTTSVAPMSGIERALAGFGRWITFALTGVLLVAWAGAVVRHLDAGAALWAWAIASSAAMAVLGSLTDPSWTRALPVTLLGAAAVPVPPRAQTTKAAFLAFGLGWLALHAGRTHHDIGRFTLFTFGDDTLEYQRFAHVVFFQGQWLQGGEKVFRWQPLYRWIIGVLHLVFGDSSIGETYVDAGALLIGALFSFEIVRRMFGFRTGLMAGTLTLLTVTLGPEWYLIGRGLSDVTAAGFVYLAAFALLGARELGLQRCLVAGVWAAFAFWTRLNHLPLVVAMVALLLPDSLATGAWYRVREVWTAIPKQPAIAYLAVVMSAVAIFSIRGWYYTGQLHVLGGVGISHAATGLGSSAASVLSLDAWRRSLESVLMIATVKDPPGFDPRAALVLTGVLAAVTAFIGAPVTRRLPLRLSAFCVGSIAFGLVVRGIGYHGRFSIHLIPIAVAISVAAFRLSAEVITPRCRLARSRS